MTATSLEDLDFSAWIGRSVTSTDMLTAGPADRLAATLDREDPPFRDGDPLPPAWHYLYFGEVVPLSETGADGHQKKGAFIPPVPLPRRMWAGSRMLFERPLRIGDKARKVTTITDVQAKTGRTGLLCFLTLTEDVLGSDDRLATREIRTQVYRGLQSPKDRPEAPRPAPAQPAWTRAIDPGSVLLFRYSALTMNSHRIHYDLDYVREVEKLPGLLVHGPLIMTLLLDLFRREAPDRDIRSFDLRAMAPIYHGRKFFLHGAPGEETDHFWLWAATGDDHLAMTCDVVSQ